MEYDMTPYEEIARQFMEYLNQNSSELDAVQGMGHIQLYDGSNYDKINKMKDNFCKKHGINRADVNVRWALSKGITQYCFCYLGFVPEEIDWDNWQRLRSK